MIDIDELRKYKKEHTIAECAEHFCISTKMINRLSSKYKINSFNYIDEINKDEFLKYRQNYNVKQTAEHFNICIGSVIKLSRKINIKHKNTTKRESCPKEFSKEQQEYFLGNMLGDGSLSTPKNKNSNSKFSINQQLNKSEYIKSLYEIYKPFSSGYCEGKHKKPSIINGKINSDVKYWNGEYSEHCVMYTMHLPIFTEFRNKWYKDPYVSNRDQKIIPKDITLSWTAAATWACDDGSNLNTISPSNTGKFPYRVFTLHTESFQPENVELLIYRLKKDLDIIGKLNWSSHKPIKKPIIVLYGENQMKFCHGIKPFIPWECFQYKCTTRDVLPIGERNSHNNTSGQIGVFYDNTHNKWIAKHSKNGKVKRKYFQTKEDAISTRKLWEKE